MMSAFLTVDNLCATMSTVIEDAVSEPPLPRASISSMASCTRASLSASRALVASSNNRIFGFRTRARAMATLCFCPPLSCTPRSPTSVSYPNGSFSIKSWALAKRAASLTSSSVGSSSVPSKPYIIFR
mmetsp:Transcript_38596/g.54326  ORF Transcript_38596/g.54326 Transcript_38596/m.54326 type:complete len:128 (-) Transcript_38596:1852-2235(-)